MITFPGTLNRRFKMLANPFDDPFQAHSGPSTPDIFRRPRAGGVSRPSKQETASEAEADPGTGALVPDDHGEQEEAPKKEGAAAEKVILRNPRWEVETVGFNEETEISVEADLPDSQAHKTKVEFELFAETPDGPESISKGQGNIQSGRAVCKIPVYIPQFKDEFGNLLNKVKYFFTAKHSMSDLLEDDTVAKVVDHMANRVIERHILEDITFANGKSQIRASQAAALRTLVDHIGAWKKRNPDGKLAVFGHVDAVGKEQVNKELSERRAKVVQAFLVKDASGWKAISNEEKWDMKGEPDAKAFMSEHNSLALTDKDFESIDGKPYTGCSEFNRVEEVQGASEKNRRVSVFLLKSNKNFPIQYPCKHGEISACRKQKDRKGQRRTPGFGCCFYDGLVQEKAGTGSAGEGKVLDVHFENDAGEKVAVTRAGKKVSLVLRSENLIRRKIDIDLSDVPFDLEYQGKMLEKGLLEAVEVTGDLQRIEFVPRKRSGKKPEGGGNG